MSLLSKKFEKILHATEQSNFHRCTVESTLTGCIMAWPYNSNAQEYKRLQRMVDSSRSIMGTALHIIESINEPLPQRLTYHHRHNPNPTSTNEYYGLVS